MLFSTLRTPTSPSLAFKPEPVKPEPGTMTQQQWWAAKVQPTKTATQQQTLTPFSAPPVNTAAPVPPSAPAFASASTPTPSATPASGLSFYSWAEARSNRAIEKPAPTPAPTAMPTPSAPVWASIPSLDPTPNYFDLSENSTKPSEVIAAPWTSFPGKERPSLLARKPVKAENARQWGFEDIPRARKEPVLNISEELDKVVEPKKRKLLPEIVVLDEDEPSSKYPMAKKFKSAVPSWQNHTPVWAKAEPEVILDPANSAPPVKREPYQSPFADLALLRKNATSTTAPMFAPETTPIWAQLQKYSDTRADNKEPVKATQSAVSSFVSKLGSFSEIPSAESSTH